MIPETELAGVSGGRTTPGDGPPPLTPAKFQENFEMVVANVETFVKGKQEVVRHALLCLFAEGHLLIEDFPGVAKTSLAKAIAASFGCALQRIQFTPDLLPSDITGVMTYDLRTATFSFKKGPVFTNILIGDEINRASPKTQSALLEAMAERRVTIGRETHQLERPFLCIATQNPVDHQGTYELPEAQLDRFAMRIRIGYPGPIDEDEILVNGLQRMVPESLKSVVSIDRMLGMFATVQDVHMAPHLRKYIVDIMQATRKSPRLRLAASPRASIALALCAQARASSLGRDHATVEDVLALIEPVLAHRLLLSATALAERHTTESVLMEIVAGIPSPRKPGS